MNDRTMGRVAVVLALLLVLVVALILFTRGPGTTATQTASPSVSASPLGPSVAPSETAAASPSDAASPSASSGASPSPSGADAPATFTVVDLKLDATDDPDGLARTISFTSDAPGTITVSLATSTPKGTTHMCLSQGSKEIGCQDWAKGTFTRTTNQSNVTWTVTVIGDGTETPVVDVSATFPSRTPSVHIEDARLDGTEFPEYNGITVAFQARTAGSAGLVATWGEQPLTYEIAVTNGATGTTDVSGATNDGVNSPSIPVDAGSYRLSLKDTGGGPGSLRLTATVSWP